MQGYYKEMNLPQRMKKEKNSSNKKIAFGDNLKVRFLSGFRKVFYTFLHHKIFQFFKLFYIKLFKINDSPQRIALGLGLGVFAGIIPGTGPLAALFLAFIFRLNRASALLGSLLTNTWLSFVTFILAIKVGSAILKINWQEVHKGWVLLLERFNWQGLFKLSVLKAVFPVVVGYIIIAFCLGVLTYLITWVIIIGVKKKGGL